MTKRRANRRTFRQLIADLRQNAAKRAWERATLASRLRHAMARSGRGNTARMLGDIKQTAIERVAELLPDELGVTIDSDQHIGLVSVRWNGHGRLHLPADVELPARV